MAAFQRISCKICAVPIWRSRGRVNENLKFKHGFYCSKKCISLARRNRKLIQCENKRCGKTFDRVQSGVSPHNFCSRSCAVAVNNQRFPKRGIGPRECANNSCKNLVKGWLKYCSAECREGVRRRFTKKELILSIQNTVNSFGRTPAKREVVNLAGACVYYFGSWNNAIVAAGFTPNRSDDHRMYKRAKAKALDGHICDSISEVIVDNWLTKNNVIHQKGARYANTNFRADWLVGDTFVEYFGLTNDSPRYDREIKRKRNFCRRNNLKLMAIYPKDLYPKVLLDNKLKELSLPGKWSMI